jgi:putative peptidoglycan lipid II flippase
VFAIGLVFFTVHFLMLRGYYSLERTRTVFWVQCVIAAANIALAVVLTRAASAEDTSTALVLAYTGAYAIGASVSYLLLRHLLGGLETGALVRFLLRLLPAAGLAAATAWAVRYGAGLAWPEDDGKIRSLVMLVALSGIFAGVFLLLARALRIREVTGIMELVAARLGR